jgi:hypothetical protein
MKLDFCPRGWWAWKSIHLVFGARRDPETVEVRAQTGDQNNEDIGVILREGTYTLHRNPRGEWGIVGYTKTCCDADKRGELPHEPASGNAGKARGEQ